MSPGKQIHLHCVTYSQWLVEYMPIFVICSHVYDLLHHFWIFTARVRSTREGNVLTRICLCVCLSTTGGGGGCGNSYLHPLNNFGGCELFIVDHFTVVEFCFQNKGTTIEVSQEVTCHFSWHFCTWKKFMKSKLPNTYMWVMLPY